MDTSDIARRDLAPLVVATLLLSSAFAGLAQAQAVSLASPQDYFVGSSPQWLAAVDLNRDGVLDLAVSNAGSGTVSVLLGIGNGQFQAASHYPAGASPNSLVVADFNGDTLLDVATSNYIAQPGNVSLLLGNGNGTLQPPLTILGGGNKPYTITAGDFNRDGNRDLALANFGDNAPTDTTVSVVLGNGNGTFQMARVLQVQRGPLWVSVADFNGDGADDIVTANFGGTDTVSVLLGNNDGTFQAARNFPAGSGPSSVAAGDFDGDGRRDLGVANYYSHQAAVLWGNGDGTFQAPQFYAVGPSPTSVVVADVDGDGARDLVVANWDGNAGLTFSILRGNGDGTFWPKQDFIAGRGVVGAIAADLDADGTLDVAVANYNAGTVSVLINDGAPPPPTHTLNVSNAGTGSGTVTSNPAGINCGADCSESYSAGTVVTLTASPAGGSTFSGWSGAGCSGTGTCSVTMNAAASVTATFTAQPLSFTLSVSKAGTGSGTVTSSPAGINCGADCSEAYSAGTVVTLTASPASGSTFSGWSGAGCSGTGACTVIVTSNATVTAGFDATTAVSAPVLKWQYGGCVAGPFCDTGWYSSPAVADLDGDGQADVIWGSYDVVALNGATGSLKWRGPSASRVWPGIAVADLTGNGTPEVIVGRGADQVTVYDRTGAAVWTRNPFGAGEVRSLAVADLEADGLLEIIAGSASTSTTYQVNVFEPNGTVRSGWPARHVGDLGFGAGLFNENLVVADMNGDGFKEVFAPTASHYITALDRNGAQLGVNGVYAPRQFWSQVGVGVDNAVDLRGFAHCGTEHRPNFENSAPVVADVNGDGVPEVIVVGDINDCATNTSLYQMPFILKRDRTRWSGSGFDWTAIPAPGPGSAPRSVDFAVIETAVPNPAVVDLDGDGFKEILYPSYDGKVHAYWLDKTEHGSWPYVVPTMGMPGDNFRFASEPVVADLNNDGDPEVIFTSWPKKGTAGVGQLHVLSSLGQELFRVTLPAPGIGDTWNGGLAAPTLANIDSDPDLEVVVGTVSSGAVAYDLPNSANARVLWGTGRGNYQRTGTPPP